MQGSFTADSADKFFQLMREAGYETQEVPSEGELQNFSAQGASLGGVWQGNIAEFGEVRGEYIDVVDFTRCERPDGSAYGTKGKCKKGSETAKVESQKKGSKFTHEVHADLERGFSKKELNSYVKYWGGEIGGETGRGVVARFPDEKSAKSFAKNVQFRNDIKGVNVSEHDVNPIDHSEGEIDSLDYTRCARPDGSVYGTGGKCRKGVETSAKAAAPEKSERGVKAKVTPDERWDSERKKTYDSLKGMTKRDVLNKLNQYQRIHGLSEKDTMADLKGAVLGAIHGNTSPSESQARSAAKMASVERKRADKVQSLRTNIQETSDKIDKIVESGGKVGLNDPLSKQLKQQVEELKKLRRFETVPSVAPIAPVPPKQIKDPVPGILRSQAEIKKIIADKPETPNSIRNAAGQPLNLTIARVKALSDKDLESEWNRAKTAGRKEKLRAELDRRKAAAKATPKAAAAKGAPYLRAMSREELNAMDPKALKMRRENEKADHYAVIKKVAKEMGLPATDAKVRKEVIRREDEKISKWREGSGGQQPGKN